jgi:hypothetical protein
LQGDQIPLLARVIAVADTFDALTTNRPYQRAYEPPEALRIIQGLVGKRLDPKAVAALIAVYERGEIKVRRLVRAQATPPPLPAPTSSQVPTAPVPPPVAEPATESKAAAARASASGSAVDPAVHTTRF